MSTLSLAAAPAYNGVPVSKAIPMTAPRPQPGILDISAYVPGASGGGSAIKLSANESPLGPSRKAIEAYASVAASLERYPDGGALALRQALAAAHGLDAARIVCGSGSDELLYLIATAYLGQGTEALFTEHSFAIFKLATLGRGATPVIAPEQDLTTDIDALLARVSAHTRVVFLANPNNPTGTYIPFSEVRRLHRGLPEETVLVLDAAYAEYVRRGDYEAGLELVSSTRNTIMTRTFSKVYGLAGLRLGWAYCPEHIADVLNRIRPAFNVSSAAQAAGIAALGDRAHIDAAVAFNDRWLPWMTQRLSALGLMVVPSAGNFVLVGFRDAKGAAAADLFLRARHIYLRPMGAYGLGHTLRLTIGTETENKAVVAALTDFTDAMDKTS